MSLMQRQPMLSGRSILVVEDEAILALDLSLTLEDAGATVVGPMHHVEQALARTEGARLDAALLDVDVNGRSVYPLADRLQDQGIPLVFHTARSDLHRIRAEYPGAYVLPKLCRVEELVHALARSITDSVWQSEAANSAAS